MFLELIQQKRSRKSILMLLLEFLFILDLILSCWNTKHRCSFPGSSFHFIMFPEAKGMNLFGKMICTCARHSTSNYFIHLEWNELDLEPSQRDVLPNFPSCPCTVTIAGHCTHVLHTSRAPCVKEMQGWWCWIQQGQITFTGFPILFSKALLCS